MFTAKHHLRIGKKTFRPGDEVPPELMSDEVWKRLYQKGAITGTPDPVEAVLKDEGETTGTPHQPPRAAASPQGEAYEENADDNAKEENAAEDQQAEEAAEKEQQEEPKAESKKASGKKGSSQKAAASEKEPELPMIDAGAMVVDKPKNKKGA